jgi:Ca2+-binding EF-hand superfamily protein
VDKNGSKTIDSEEFMVFLKRTGIEISQHKLKEIFVSIKGSSAYYNFLF